MSFILDALRKSEQERERKPVPDITSMHVSNDAFALRDVGVQRLSLVLLVSIFSLLALAVILLVVLLLRQSEPVMSAPGMDLRDSEARVQPAIELDASEAVQVEEAAVQGVAVQEGIAEAPVGYAAIPKEAVLIDSEIQALYERRSEDARAKRAAPKGISLRASEPSMEPSMDQALAQALWDASEIQKETPIPKHLQTQQAEELELVITPEPKRAAEEPETVDAPFEETLAAFELTPFLHELSENTQTSIPTLMYSEHQYVNGYVMINRQTLQAGEDVSGVMVEKILVDGVVFSFKGADFKLSALSSWVNY